MAPLFVLLISLATQSTMSFAQTQISTATIPMNSKGIPATDLVDSQANPLTIQQLQQMRSKGSDISQLNPMDSDLWKKTGAITVPDLPLKDGVEVTYDSVSDSRTGNFRFNGYAMTPNGQQAFQFLVSRTSHDLLLRQALLLKLGYRLDPLKWLKTVKINFNSSLEAEDFLLQWQAKTMGATSRLVVSGKPDDRTLTIQDVIVQPTQFTTLNIAAGTVPGDYILGRRTMNSLVLPFAMVQVPESVNLFGWEIGTIFNGSLQVDTESSDPSTGNSTFMTPYEDAEWMARRLRTLSRNDWTQIVKAAHYPAPVEMLIIEKLIARRNSLMRLLKVGGSDLNVNANITSGTDLKNGKITRVYNDNWPGYTARFSLGDPESPLSSEHKLELAHTELDSLLIQNAVNAFNNHVLYNTDINTQLAKVAADRMTKDLQSLVTTGKLASSPIGVDMSPFGASNLILSRDIVSGSYLGSDNLVSIVDSIGLNLGVGVQLQVYGLPDAVFAGVNVAGTYTRTYSHLKPLSSLKSALKEPFHNMIVPLVQNHLSNFLEIIGDTTLAKLKTDDGKKAFDKAMSDLKDNLKVGESLIITDSIGPAIQVIAGYEIVPKVDAYAKFKAQQLTISRTHILRATEDTIQVYRDLGQSYSIGLSLQLDAIATIVQLQAQQFDGHVKTKFYSVPLTTPTPDDPTAATTLRELQSLRAAVRMGSLEALNDVEKPYVLDSGVAATTAQLDLLFFDWKWQSSKDLIAIQAPTGETRNYQQRTRGKRSGTDYEDFIIDVATGLLKTGVGNEIELARIGGTDPANTIGGHSEARIVTYEAQINGLKGSVGHPTDEVVKLQYRWKGWTADQKKLLGIVSDINSKVGQQIVSASALHDTTRMDLYNLQLNYILYAGAFDKLIGNIEAAKAGMKAAGKSIFSIQAFQNKLQKMKTADQQADFDEYSTLAIKMISDLESSLGLQKLINLVGANNIFVYAEIDGFREGDEAGDQTFVSSTLGHVGSVNSQGPLTALRKKLGISESELYANWFLEAL